MIALCLLLKTHSQLAKILVNVNDRTNTKQNPLITQQVLLENIIILN